MTVKVIKIFLLEDHGPDHIDLMLDLPNGIYPFEGNCQAKVQVAAGQGFDYIKEHFKGVPYKRIWVTRSDINRMHNEESGVL